MRRDLKDVSANPMVLIGKQAATEGWLYLVGEVTPVLSRVGVVVCSLVWCSVGPGEVCRGGDCTSVNLKGSVHQCTCR
jgi:hypothetical protein